MLSSLTSCIRSSISNGQANEDRFLACLSLLKKHFCIRLHQLVSKSFKIFSFPVEGLTLHHPFRSQPSNPLLTLPALSRNCAPLTLPFGDSKPKGFSLWRYQKSNFAAMVAWTVPYLDFSNRGLSLAVPWSSICSDVCLPKAKYVHWYDPNWLQHFTYARLQTRISS